MDGGIDLVYSMRFGWDLEKRLRERLKDQHHGYLTTHLKRVPPPADLMEASRGHFELLGHEWLL
jgi:hypothetical protein